MRKYLNLSAERVAKTRVKQDMETLLGGSLLCFAANILKFLIIIIIINPFLIAFDHDAYWRGARNKHYDKHDDKSCPSLISSVGVPSSYHWMGYELSCAYNQEIY